LAFRLPFFIDSKNSSDRDSETGSQQTPPSRGESTNHRFRRRVHGLEITKEKQRVSEALARVDAQREQEPGSSAHSAAKLGLRV
jgi:hypothetical protein